MTTPPLVIGWPEMGWFLLANAIIVWICAPRLLRDIRGWLAPRSRADNSRPER